MYLFIRHDYKITGNLKIRRIIILNTNILYINFCIGIYIIKVIVYKLTYTTIRRACNQKIVKFR